MGVSCDEKEEKFPENLNLILVFEKHIWFELVILFANYYLFGNCARNLLPKLYFKSETRNLLICQSEFVFCLFLFPNSLDLTKGKTC